MPCDVPAEAKPTKRRDTVIGPPNATRIDVSPDLPANTTTTEPTALSAIPGGDVEAA